MRNPRLAYYCLCLMWGALDQVQWSDHGLSAERLGVRCSAVLDTNITRKSINICHNCIYP